MRQRLLAAVLALCTFPALAAPAPSQAPAPLDRFAGKVVYVDFWASWCAPCAESFPWLNTLKTKFGSRLVVVGVNVDENSSDADAFLEHHPANFLIVRDPKGILASNYNLPGMPTGLILDAHGKVIHEHSGFLRSKVSEYENAIADALGPSSSAETSP